MNPEPIAAPDRGGISVPVVRVESADELVFNPQRGALRYSVPLDDRGSLDALMLNKGSRALVVVFHGAMLNGRHHLPRFEWLRTLDERAEYSCLFLSDPTLSVDSKLLLGWYLGWEGMELYPLLGEVITKAAQAAGAEQIVLVGSSGGGFAALQVAPHLPGTLAIAFNAQTALNRYHWKAQANYIRRVRPALEDRGKSRRKWLSALGSRVSAVQTYSGPVRNRALVVQNVRDEHHYAKHYLPFKDSVQGGPNAQRVRFEEYSAAPFHEPPSRGRFVETIDRGLTMLEDWTA
ncbi:ACP S-malonyltransferase [Nesterenkonia halotolerans]|uniref:Pimeloyl-ACP methyl ester carboxylesterase n=1 Tax=Nesterenkonia halotolerans TaxID=225325 RepID=A0ABR9JAA9_9MICC|nr:hypothetical protein [Nesterenkonia halotolerans]MBE1515774.1 pimeloyl-ACP methyl ester carboxylesterase [Nesterenkonia halotolerans]